MPRQFTQAQQAQAQSMGINLQNIDWTKVGDLLKLLLAIFSGGASPSPGMHASNELRQTMKDAGCNDENLDPCCKCAEAACLSLQSAHVSLSCCQSHCEA